MARELTYHRYRSRKKKPGPTARATARKRRQEGPVIKAVREKCVARDGYCRLRRSDCLGRSEWAHFCDKKRWKTRGMKPEQRHTVEGSLMLCRRHHRQYDAGILKIAALNQDRGCEDTLVIERGTYTFTSMVPR